MTGDAIALGATIDAWMRENRRGYKAAAKVHGVTTEQARAAVAASRGGAAPLARAPTREATPAEPQEDDEDEEIEDEDEDAATDWSALPAVDYWRRVVNMAMDRAAQESNGAAAAAFLMRARDARKQLDELQPKPDTLDDIPEEQYVQMLEADYNAMAEAHLLLAVRVYGDRHGARVQLVSDEHRMELGPDGWEEIEE